ncbi:MAG: allantoinase AllB [Tissierellia bacterium]|jgi:allantoinase|nr:allantoinase AllB [Tissierellia bacterium]
MYDLLVKNGLVVTEAGEVYADILVKDGKISAIGEDLKNEEAAKVIDAEGMVITPGMIDTHAHFSEPGRTEWEGYDTGTAAAAKGGVTSFIEMPLNQLPCTQDGESLYIKLEIEKEKIKVDGASLGALTPSNLDDIQDLSDGGVVGYKAFMSTCGDRSLDNDMENVDDYSLWEGMRRIAKTGKTLGVHCENAKITDTLGAIAKANGPDTLKAYVESRPVFTEVEAVKRAIYLAQQTDVKLNICHCSCPEAVEEVTKAREAGFDYMAESCTHYFYFHTDELDDIGNTAKCSPPIRDLANQERMWEELFKGNIHFIGSDHSPCTPDLKEGTAFSAWGGISAIQNSYDIFFDEAVNKRNMPLKQFVDVTATNAAKRFGLENKGSIQVGYDADLVLIDPKASYEVTTEGLEYKNKISAYVGRTIGCQIKTTIVRGNVVYDGEKVTEETTGQLILNK